MTVGEQAAEEKKKVTLLNDAKFRWLVFSVMVVGVFEFLSPAGWEVKSGRGR